MRNILVGTASVRHNVQALVLVVVNDKVILHTALLIGEKRKHSSSSLQLGNVGDNETLNELDAVFSVNTISRSM
jgi:hypothetical protein